MKYIPVPGPVRPLKSPKAQKSEKIRYFQLFFKFTILLNFSLCQQSQVFITLRKRVQKGNPDGQPQKKKITTQKISDQMSRFAEIFGFFTISAGTHEIILSRGEHRGPNLIIMSLNHPHPRPASSLSITSFNSGSKWS